MNRILGALVCILFVGCGGSSTGDSGGSSDSMLACSHFRSVAYDASEGLLTDAELREKLKEVYDDSIIASPRVQKAAQRMLREATAGNLSAGAISAMGAACEAEGE